PPPPRRSPHTVLTPRQSSSFVTSIPSGLIGPLIDETFAHLAHSTCSLPSTASSPPVSIHPPPPLPHRLRDPESLAVSEPELNSSLGPANQLRLTLSRQCPHIDPLSLSIVKASIRDSVAGLEIESARMESLLPPVSPAPSLPPPESTPPPLPTSLPSSVAPVCTSCSGSLIIPESDQNEQKISPSVMQVAGRTKAVPRSASAVELTVKLRKGANGLGFSLTSWEGSASKSLGDTCYREVNPSRQHSTNQNNYSSQPHHQHPHQHYHHHPIYVKSILPDGAALMDGQLRQGDRLLQIFM
ncbi:unnamed protein product, partial [Protopolystoma xenopodis]